jgi:hypothetical protein
MPRVQSQAGSMIRFNLLRERMAAWLALGMFRFVDAIGRIGCDESEENE